MSCCGSGVGLSRGCGRRLCLSAVRRSPNACVASHLVVFCCVVAVSDAFVLACGTGVLGVGTGAVSPAVGSRAGAALSAVVGSEGASVEATGVGGDGRVGCRDGAGQSRRGRCVLEKREVPCIVGMIASFLDGHGAVAVLIGLLKM